MSEVSFKDFLIKSKGNIKKAKEYQKAYNMIMESGLFDKDFYLASYPHIARENINPLIHYLFHGFRENKLPSPQFNLDKYLEEHPEVKNNNLNPLIHCIENNHKGYISTENPALTQKKKILDTNSVFLKNEEFEEEPLVSIIIPNRNGLKHLQRLFKDFKQKTNYSNFEIIVVDNASCDKSVEYLISLKEQLPIEIIENNENLSFSKANNQAAEIANGEYLLLLNNDIEPTFGWLNEMMSVMLNNENVGSVGAKLIFPYYQDMENQPKSYAIQHAGVKFREERTPYVYGPYHENMFLTLIFSDKVNFQKEVIANTAACLLIPKKIYDECGGLDEGYFYGYEDIDFAFKLHSKGYKSVYAPYALLFHHESATRLDDSQVHQRNYENIMHFVDRWGDYLFKAILKDKINNTHFITNKKLDISIIGKSNPHVNKLAIDLNNQGYNVKIIPDLENLAIGEDCDILISTEKDYEIAKVSSRLNLIKILISDDSEDSQNYHFTLKSLTAKDLINLIEKEFICD